VTYGQKSAFIGRKCAGYWEEMRRLLGGNALIFGVKTRYWEEMRWLLGGNALKKKGFSFYYKIALFRSKIVLKQG